MSLVLMGERSGCGIGQSTQKQQGCARYSQRVHCAPFEAGSLHLCSLRVNGVLFPSCPCPKAVLKILGKMKSSRKWRFVALFINARHVCAPVETISIGTLNASLVHPREVFQPAMEQ